LVKQPLRFGSIFMVGQWIWDFSTIISQQTQPQIVYSCKFPSLCYYSVTSYVWNKDTFNF
jgi:hypothetical protein